MNLGPSALARPVSIKPSPRESGRLAYVDNLRVALTVLVIAHHAVEPYGWESRWRIFDDPFVPGLWTFPWVNLSFFMGAFFLLAGVFTPASYDRRRARAFGRERAIRLGVPLLIGAALIIPLQAFFVHRVTGSLEDTGYWRYFTRDYLGFGTRPDDWAGPRWPEMELGHLWFLQHLWIYACLYILWRSLRRRFFSTGSQDAPSAPPPSHVAIVIYAVALTLVTWAVRQAFAAGTWVGFLGFIQMEPAHMPQYVSLFVIGVVAGRRGWLETMPKRRGLVWLSVGAGAAIAMYVLGGTGLIGRLDPRGGLGSAWDSVICTGLCVGLPVAFRQFASGRGRLLRALSSSAYAAYVLHFPVVILAQWALAGSGLPIGARIVIGAVGSIVVTFALSHALLRVPGVRRIF